MRVVLAVAALVAVAGAASVSLEELEFQSWKREHDKSYGSEEEESQRKMIWMNNLKLVLEHNMLADQGLKTYRLGLNIFADMDDQEYQKYVGCLKSFNRTKIQHVAPFHHQAELHLPETVDWREKGFVTKVKNQGDCGSCWAFSATGALEAQMFKKTGELVLLSVQQLVDCSWTYDNNGCEGGDPEWAFKYIKKNKGLQTEKSYPYKKTEKKCKSDHKNIKPTCISIKPLPEGNENALKEAVAIKGPVSVSIDASRFPFRHYESGVYEDPFCSNSTLNHSVLVVGYGTENGQDYWLVKNSHGVKWGEKGYIKMARNKNMCGIATEAVYPVVKDCKSEEP